MEMHRANPQCRSCHQYMDPIGLALDNFDVTAKWRTRENGMPLDTKGDYPHNGLSGLCFDSRGDLTFGMGENLGPVSFPRDGAWPAVQLGLPRTSQAINPGQHLAR